MANFSAKIDKKIVFSIVLTCAIALVIGFARANNQGVREGVLTIDHPGTPDRYSIAAESHDVVSPVMKGSFPFTALVVRWDAPEESTATIAIRFLHESWSEWMAVEPDEDVRDDAQVKNESSVIPVKRTDTFQYKLTFERPQDRIAYESISFHYLDTSAGPRNDFSIAAEETSDLPLVTRKQWGADESYSLTPTGEAAWEEEYYTPKRFVIHHTGGVDANKNPAATVRAIYYWHAMGRGWGDIGYNYLIDSKGTIYEGRRGGEGVVGGHTYLKNRGSIGIALLGCYQLESGSSDASSCAKVDKITPEMTQALTRLIAIKSREFGMQPDGTVMYEGSRIPIVTGHRDNGHTNCPGVAIYNELSSIRASARTLYDALPRLTEGTLAAQFVRVSTDTLQIPANRTGEAIVEFKNTGTIAWRGYEDDYVFLADSAVKQKLGALGTVRIAAVTNDPAVPAAKLLGGNVYPGQVGRFKLTVLPRVAKEKRTFTLAWDKKGYFPETDVTLNIVRTAAVADGALPYSAQVAENKLPALMGVNDAVSGSISFTNTSSTPIPSDKLALKIAHEGVYTSPFAAMTWPDQWGMFTPAEKTVAVGSNVVFTIPFQAPSVAGVYAHSFTLLYDGAPIAEYVHTFTVGEHNAAIIVSHTIPNAVDNKWRQKVTITVKNNGVESWNGLVLTTGTPKYAYSRFIDASWKHKSRIMKTTDVVAPGQTTDLTFYLDAAYLNGTYTHWYKLATSEGTLLSIGGKDRLELQTKVTKAQPKK